jgi:serine/threonine protein kinase
MWALGVTLHYLLGGIHPFLHDDEEVMNRKISRAYFDFTSPYWFQLTRYSKELVRQLLTKLPSERCTAEKAIVAPWLVASLLETSRQPNIDLFNPNSISNGTVSPFSAFFCGIYVFFLVFCSFFCPLFLCSLFLLS